MSAIVNVFYYLQDESSRELYLYNFESPRDKVITVGDVVNSFPVPGKFHFRFRTDDELGNGSIWLDSTDVTSPVPRFRGNMIVKALQLPPFSNPSLTKPKRKEYKASHSAKKLHHSRTKTPQSNLIEFPAMEKKNSLDRSHSQTPLQHQHHHHHQKQDLFFQSKPFQTPQFGQSKPSQPPEQPKNLDTEYLRAQKEKFIKEQEAIKAKQARDIMSRESHLQSAKFEASKQYGDKLDNWVSRNHQKNNIRSLLATLHEVIWEGSEWQPRTPADLVQNSQVKRAYYAAIGLTHPDKHQNDPPHIQYTADRIFSALNEAWKVFQS